MVGFSSKKYLLGLCIFASVQGSYAGGHVSMRVIERSPISDELWRCMSDQAASPQGNALDCIADNTSDETELALAHCLIAQYDVNDTVNYYTEVDFIQSCTESVESAGGGQ